jgi:hypothetical protein
MAATPKGLSDEKAARMMVALREGRTLRTFGVKAPRLEAYFKAHPKYASAVRPLILANSKAAFLHKGAYIRNKTHCVNGHSFAEHGRTAMHKGWMTRQCRACEVMRHQRGGVMKAEVLEKVTARILAGSSLNSFTKSQSGVYLLKFSTLARHRRENPTFDRFVREATKDNNSKGQLRRWRRIKSNVIRDQNNDYCKILALIPGYVGDKAAIVSLIFEDLLNGRLKRENVPARVREYVAAQDQMFPTKYRTFAGRPLLSLDEQPFEDGATTRGDTVSKSLWD